MIREILSVLFPYIVILYLTDSLQLISKCHVLFVNYIGKKYYLKRSGFYISKLSPIGITVLSQDLPIYFTASGLYKINDQRPYDKPDCKGDDYEFMAYKNIDTVEVDGKEIKLNGRKYIKVPSSIIANLIRDRINNFKTIKPAKRNNKVQTSLEEAFDIDTIKSLNRSYVHHIRYIQILSLFLSVNTFIILPSILYSRIYLYINISLIIINIVLAYLMILITTFQVHKKIYKTENKPRIYSLLSMIFLPVSAMHATHYITSDLYAQFNYLAVARLLLPSNVFINMVRNELCLIEHRKSMINNSDLLDYWGFKEKCLSHLIEKSGLTTDNVLAIPEKQDENAKWYCPICLTEYISNHGGCSDCGVGLEMYLRSQWAIRDIHK